MRYKLYDSCGKQYGLFLSYVQCYDVIHQAMKAQGKGFIKETYFDDVTHVDYGSDTHSFYVERVD